MTRDLRGRSTRTAALAVVLILLSVTAHATAAASLPSAVGLIAAAIVSAALALAVGTKRRSFLWLVGYLVAGQLLLHVVMTAMGHHALSLVPDRTMLGAHLLAALTAAVLFVRSEAIAAAWIRASRRILGSPQFRLPIIAAPADPRVDAGVSPLVPRLHCRTVITRGPPVFV